MEPSVRRRLERGPRMLLSEHEILLVRVGRDVRLFRLVTQGEMIPSIRVERDTKGVFGMGAR